MKNWIFTSVTLINIAALVFLTVVWWINGREETWFFLVCAAIVLSSFLYAKPKRGA